MKTLQLRLLGIACLITAFALLLLAGCAGTPQDKAAGAAINDTASTLAALAVGGAEANPLGLLLIPIKLGTLEYAKGLPDGQREHAQSQISAIWGGATVSNWCTFGVLLTGGATAIPCLVIGLGYGLHEWQSTQAEREFWAICADEKKRNPLLVCTYLAQ